MDYWWNIINLILIFSIFSISLNLLLGYAGQVSVAHAAFGAVGGYLAAYLGAHAGVGFLGGLAIGAVGAGVVGVLVSLPALRLSAEYLILLTIAVSSIVLAIVGAVPALGGNLGLVANQPASLSPLPGGTLLFPSDWVLPLIFAAALTYLVCRRLGESAWGRVLRGIRDDDVATRALGHNIVSYKAAVFGITAAFAGFGGVLLFYYNQLASPDVYGFSVSLQIFAMVIFGGLGNFAGSVVGAAVLTLLQPLLEKVINIDPTKSFLVELVIYGLGLVLLMRLRPQGLVPEGTSLLELVRRRRRGDSTELEGKGVMSVVPAPVPIAPPPDPDVPAEILLSVRDLEKSFGGIAACRGLDLELRRGEITALVGPNGAGKTTVFNLLTGTLRADAGSVLLRGEEIRGRTPDQIARKGMARTFQDVRLFGRLSVLDNVMLGVRGEHLANLFVRPDLARAGEHDARGRALHWLDVVGLAGVAGTPVASLSFGQQKLVSLARLLATDADVLLLDEPASGVDARWVDTILELVAFVRGQGKTVCIVEHSLHVVEQLADTVFFMELGRITARGSISELTSDDRLAEVYFGTV